MISANGTFYQTCGDTDAPALVLIHGLGLASGTWDGYVETLAQNHYVIAYDLFGHGASVAPPQTPSLTVFSEQIVALMDELNLEAAALVGFSLGGMINRRVAMDYPDRVSSLAILNSPHERGEEAQKLVEERAKASDAGGPGATLDTTIARWFTADFIAQYPDQIQRVRDWVLANDHKSYAQCRFVLANGVVELIRPKPAITHPSLVMTCEHDTGSTPAMSHAIASEIAGAQTVIVPDLQHMGLFEQPQTFLPPIQGFLAKQNGL